MTPISDARGSRVIHSVRLVDECEGARLGDGRATGGCLGQCTAGGHGLIDAQLLGCEEHQLQGQVLGQAMQACFVALVGDAGQAGEIVHRQLVPSQAVDKQLEQFVQAAAMAATQPGNDLYR